MTCAFIHPHLSYNVAGSSLVLTMGQMMPLPPTFDNSVETYVTLSSTAQASA